MDLTIDDLGAVELECPLWGTCVGKKLTWLLCVWPMTAEVDPMSAGHTFGRLLGHTNKEVGLNRLRCTFILATDGNPQLRRRV